MDPFAILGEVIVKEASMPPLVVGAAFGGFDPKMLIDAASDLSKRGVDTYEQGEADKKTSAATAAQLAKAIAADANWASAEAVLELATQSQDASRIGPAQALQSAAAANAASAGMGLPPDAVAKRVAAAQDAANNAAQASLANPKDALKQATMRAWQKVLVAAGSMSGGLMKGGGAHGGGQPGNWLTKKFGPLPVWGWGVVGVGTVVAGVVVVKLLRR